MPLGAGRQQRPLDRLEQFVRQSFWRSSAPGALVIGRCWIVWSRLSSSVATRCARCSQFRQGVASPSFLGREDTHSHFSNGARRHTAGYFPHLRRAARYPFPAAGSRSIGCPLKARILAKSWGAIDKENPAVQDREKPAVQDRRCVSAVEGFRQAWQGQEPRERLHPGDQPWLIG